MDFGKIILLIFFVSIGFLSVWVYWCLLEITLASWGNKKAKIKWGTLLNNLHSSTTKKIKWGGLMLFAIVGFYVLSSGALFFSKIVCDKIMIKCSMH